MRRITVPSTAGPTKCAVVFQAGNLYVNVSPAYAKWPLREAKKVIDAFNITHGPSGCAAARGMSFAAAKALCERLAHLDWEFDHPSKMPAETRKQCGALISRELRGSDLSWSSQPDYEEQRVKISRKPEVGS